MALRESGKIARADIFDTPFIYDAGRNVASLNQVSQPLGRIRVNLVVISRHANSSQAHFSDTG
ncbi:hypothetical protein [Pseudomonas moraviensis]|uniref:hypothetical protein n=1 Tax=Pseudomonas moraviensis TaxID=321662 RepID=UPI001FD7955A|nr:hypothetical protein [Pseudomonas moraviensis]